jgi:hypothetical protein
MHFGSWKGQLDLADKKTIIVPMESSSDVFCVIQKKWLQLRIYSKR